MKRYVKAGVIGDEIISVRDQLDTSGVATTKNKEVADMYAMNKNPNKKFQVDDNGDSFTISVEASAYDYEDGEELDDEWSPYHGHKYLINGGYENKYADTPVKAIQIWFQLGKKNPTDTAISTPKKDYAIELVTAATPEVIERMYNKYGSCYKLDYLIDEAAKKAADGCKFFYEDKYGYGDQIHPFCYG